MAYTPGARPSSRPSLAPVTWELLSWWSDARSTTPWMLWRCIVHQVRMIRKITFFHNSISFITSGLWSHIKRKIRIWYVNWINISSNEQWPENTHQWTSIPFFSHQNVCSIHFIIGLVGLVLGPIFRQGGVLSTGSSESLTMLLWNFVGMWVLIGYYIVTSVLMFGALYKLGIFR